MNTSQQLTHYGRLNLTVFHATYQHMQPDVFALFKGSNTGEFISFSLPDFKSTNELLAEGTDSTQ